MIDLFKQIVTFIYKQGRFPLGFNVERKRESHPGNQLVANTQFLVALVTSESQFRGVNGVACHFAVAKF